MTDKTPQNENEATSDMSTTSSATRSGISSATRSGISLGCVLAVAISYTTNKSILWAILHGIFSWLFVIYAAIFYP